MFYSPLRLCRCRVVKSVFVHLSDLFAHAVYAIRPQQVDGLLDQVRSSTVEHPEAEILQELGLRGGCIKLPGGAETVLGSADGIRSITVIKWELISEMDFEISGYSSSLRAEGK